MNARSRRRTGTAALLAAQGLTRETLEPEASTRPSSLVLKGWSHVPTTTIGDAITELEQSVEGRRETVANKSLRDRMPSRKVLLILFLVPTAMSLLRLFRIMITASSSSPPPPFPPLTPTLPLGCSSCPPPPATVKAIALTSPAILTNRSISTSPPDTLAPKELRLVASIVARRAPCNLLFFGFRPQFLALSGLNAGARTVFLEDDVRNLKAAPRGSNSVRVYKVEYNATASTAYDLLRRARADPACAAPTTRVGLRASKCPLALSRLPTEVYDREWDVVVVDGPSGDRPEAPGRMGAIYSAGAMARAGRLTDVVVHDVDRTVEKWYAWEYLCHQNLVSSKGKLWHFRIRGNSTSTGFCSEAKVAIM